MAEREYPADLPDDRAATGDASPAAGGAGDAAAVLLSEDDFLPDPRRKPPGPGLPESLGWIVCLIVLQTIGAVVGIVLALASRAANFELEEFARMLREMESEEQVTLFVQQLLDDSMLPLLCGVQSVFLVGAVAAALLRLGKNSRLSLPLRTVPIPHAVIIGLLIVPLMLFGDSLFRFAAEYWEMFLSQFPGMEQLDQSSSMDVIANLAPTTPFVVLLLLIAFVPAVAEELFFRGIIGRGLVARWGMVAGIVLTSLLFAAVHVHPVHAFALLPLAACIHLAYLSTRSFWAPMAMHFINNACAVAALKFSSSSFDLSEPAASVETSPVLCITAGLCIASLAALLWQMRVEYVLPDGTRWDPGFHAADVPPESLDAEKRYSPPDWRLLTAVAVSGMLLVAAAYTHFSAAADAV